MIFEQGTLIGLGYGAEEGFAERHFSTGVETVKRIIDGVGFVLDVVPVGSTDTSGDQDSETPKAGSGPVFFDRHFVAPTKNAEAPIVIPIDEGVGFVSSNGRKV